MALTLLEPQTQQHAADVACVFGYKPDGTKSLKDWLKDDFRVRAGAKPRAVLLTVLAQSPRTRRRPSLVPEDQAEREWLNLRGLHPEEVWGTPWRTNSSKTPNGCSTPRRTNTNLRC